MSKLIRDQKIDKVFWLETRFNSDEGEVMERKPIYKQSFFKKLTPFFEYEGEITTNTKMVYRFMISSDEGYEPFYYKREGEQLFFNCDADFYLEHYHNRPEMFP